MAGSFFSARIVVAPVVGLAVEVEVGFAGQPVEGLVVPDFDAVKEDRVVAQLHLEGSQGEVHFEELVAQGDGAVFPHHALDAGVKERGDFFRFFNRTQRMARAGEAFVRAHVGGTVGAEVVDAGDPARERDIEFGQTVDVAAFDPQRGFEVALDRADEPLDLTFAPSVVGLGVEETNAQIGADDAGMRVDEWLALVGVEFEGQPPPQDGLLEAVQEAGGVAGQVVGGIRNEPAMVVEDHAELGGHHAPIGSAKHRPAREVHHPQIIGRGSLEGFCRTAQEPAGFDAAPVVSADLQEPHDRTERGQPPPVILPVPVEHRERRVRTLGDRLDDPQSGFLVDRAALSRVPAHGFSGQAGEPVTLVPIPPRLDRAIGVVEAVFSGPGARGSDPQALGERDSLLAQGFDVAEDLVAQKREAFFGCWRWILHGAGRFRLTPPPFQQNGYVGSPSCRPPDSVGGLPGRLPINTILMPRYHAGFLAKC